MADSLGAISSAEGKGQVHAWPYPIMCPIILYDCERREGTRGSPKSPVLALLPQGKVMSNAIAEQPPRFAPCC